MADQRAWLELTEKVFDFATNAHAAFLSGDLETKKQILMALGSNPTIKDGKLAIEVSPWLVRILQKPRTFAKTACAVLSPGGGDAQKFRSNPTRLV